VDPNVFETANAGFAQAMYEEYLRDPAAVGPEWRRLFESGVVGQRDGAEAGQRGSGAAGQEPSAPAGQLGGGAVAADPR
jgi:2-oxoglutarate dehydrogenase complex dehydrogenase (E1) component-like enzyme